MDQLKYTTIWQQNVNKLHISQHNCYVLGLTQGAFFIFHLLTKPFPSRDQPPTHLDHMTNHLTSHLTTHMTSHMPSSHLLLKTSPALYHLLPDHLILPYLIPHDSSYP